MTAQSSPTTTLSHDLFPHLVDAILTFADLPTQLAFRATSHKFLAKVDDVLFSHVLFALRHFPPSYGAGIDTAVTVLQPVPPYARLPFLPWDLDESPPTPDDLVPPVGDIPGFDPTDPDSYPYAPLSERTTSRRAQLARVRVLDYHPFRGTQAVKVGQLLTGLAVLRRRRPLPCATHAPCAVDYLNLTLPIYHRSGNVPWALFTAPPGARRYVLQVSFDPSHPFLGEALVYMDLRDVQELCIVFTPQHVAPKDGVTIGRPAYDDVPALGMLSGFLKSIAHAMWDIRDTFDIELVGLERIPPGFLGLEEGLEGDALVYAFRKKWDEVASVWIDNVRGANSAYRDELRRRASCPVKLTTLTDWHTRASSVEQTICPMLPGVNEDARDFNEWADGSRLVSADGPDEEADFLPREPWSGHVSQRAIDWMKAHQSERNGA
ncbi:hypothetical protein CC85DRAFT_281510 [Cutaneotrichosporon oleaginosum]|uniref:Uncharacterized protein n=1 Tax=Cutaneotrichosporon oleaginosum TaxID=879819 RepID=A0A0J1BEA7_9TREE|nr:uncharacterized protein CC85DRAFT_281510 [Cutaneotrichosporon oleaginosum]KLT46419.1 hypothetical protein CC85DRAFT_281510 [Cutaneotrichosporon oleaginosum]TXT15211.1 hypothetical protein COLE_01404 [Cutaneotrichosporon oleaginosum]